LLKRQAILDRIVSKNDKSLGSIKNLNLNFKALKETLNSQRHKKKMAQSAKLL